MSQFISLKGFNMRKLILLKYVSDPKRLILIYSDNTTSILDFPNALTCIDAIKNIKENLPKFLLRDAVTGHEYWSN
jgi:hypothetical protein